MPGSDDRHVHVYYPWLQLVRVLRVRVNLVHDRCQSTRQQNSIANIALLITYASAK